MIARLRVVGSVSARSPSALRAAGKSSSASASSAASRRLSTWSGWRAISVSKRRRRAAGVSSGSMAAKAAARSGCGLAAQAAVRVLRRLAPLAPCRRRRRGRRAPPRGSARARGCSPAAPPRCRGAVSPSASAARASASESTASRRVPTSRGSRRAWIEAFSVSRAPAQSSCLDCRSKSVRSTRLVVGPQREGLARRAPVAVSVSPSSSFCCISPCTPTKRVRSLREHGLVVCRARGRGRRSAPPPGR